MLGPMRLDRGTGVIAVLLSMSTSLTSGEQRIIQLTQPETQSAGAGRLMVTAGRPEWTDLFHAGSARIAGFPLPEGRLLDLDVVSFDLTDIGTRFLVSVGGDLKEVSGPAMRFFRGTVAGERGSIVSLNLFDGRFAGFLRTGGKEYTFGPKSLSAESDEAAVIEIRDDAAMASAEGICDEEEKSPDDGRSGSTASTAAAIGAGTLLRAQVALEGTVEWVARQGGVTAAMTYTLNLLSQVSAVYESEVDVQIYVPWVLMNAAEPDGYSGGSNNTGTVLGETRAKWNGTAVLRQVFRSAVHVFSTYPSGGSGRAYVNSLCGNVPENQNSYDFGVSLLDGYGGSWERRLVAHELGHNFSSPHSHCYAPELDQCYTGETGCYSGTVVQTTGTMMSYCNTRMTTFHQRERDEKVRPGAEAAFGKCVEAAGNPGEVAELSVEPAVMCAPANLQNDDGAGNGSYGYQGISRAAWVKRFTPSCYPFKLTSIDARFTHSSVAPGRAVRVLVYTEPSGSAGVAGASLVYSQDAVIQTTSSAQWNQYALSTPVVLAAGDYYIGFFDLVADTGATYPMDYDSRTAADSWMQADRTDAAGYAPFPGGAGSWMIRGHGGPISPGSVRLSWDLPCNDAAVPNQDFAVYQGALGRWNEYVSLTCTTGHQRSWLVDNPPPDSFWLVVAQNSVNEGSYGRYAAGERPPAAVACRPQLIGGVCQ